MSKVRWAIVLVILALLMAFFIWPHLFAVQKTEAPSAPSDQIFKGPTGQPYVKGPSGPPPGQ